MKRVVAVLVLLVLVVFCGLAAAQTPGVPQTVYVPVYSQVVYGNKGHMLNLATMLSIRNTDRRAPITVTEVRYVNDKGQTVRSFLKAPLLLAPLASAQYVVEESDTSGGSGPSFVVVWNGVVNVSQPVVQGIMIGTAGSQGISFITEGVTLR